MPRPALLIALTLTALIAGCARQVEPIEPASPPEREPERRSRGSLEGPGEDGTTPDNESIRYLNKTFAFAWSEVNFFTIGENCVSVRGGSDFKVLKGTVNGTWNWTLPTSETLIFKQRVWAPYYFHESGPRKSPLVDSFENVSAKGSGSGPFGYPELLLYLQSGLRAVLIDQRATFQVSLEYVSEGAASATLISCGSGP